MLDAEERTTLKQTIAIILKDVQKAVTDWQAMRTKVNDAVFDVDYGKQVFDAQEKLEIQAFLQWLDRGYFTFLGYREYAYGPSKKVKLTDALGILRGFEGTLFADTKKAEAALFETSIQSKKAFSITKTIRPATVHRLVPMDVIRIRMFDNQGKVTGERQFFGLFTSAVYNRSVQDIPLFKAKGTGPFDGVWFLSRMA